MYLGMAGPRLALVLGIAVLISLVEGRPQFGDDGIPIRRYRQSDGRHNLEVMKQPSSSQPIRPFSQADAREEVRDISQSLPVRPFNQRESDDLPVRPFDQYDNRGSTGSSSSRVVPPPSSQPVRPFSQAESTRDQGGRHTSPRREEDPNQSRAHVTPLNPRITLQSGRDGQQHRAPQHQHQNTQHHTASQRSDETPHWSSGQVRLDSGPSNAHQSTSAVLHRDNRRTNPQEQGKTSSRVEQSQQGGGSSVRMGSGKGMGDALDQGKSDGTQEVIVFPGPTKETNKGRFSPQVGSVAPNCAKGSTFCEIADNYPTEHVKVVLRKEGDTLKEFFGNDLLLNDTSISQRIDSTDENTLCQSVEQVVYPKVAQNKEEKWMYVVNQDQYIQGVRVEKCLEEFSGLSLGQELHICRRFDIPLGHRPQGCECRVIIWWQSRELFTKSIHWECTKSFFNTIVYHSIFFT